MSDNETLQHIETLKGHNGWVTSLATTASNPDILVSGSRDKSAIVWQLTPNDSESFGRARRSLRGHSHIVQDVTISSDGQFVLSASWDKTLRLWNLKDGTSTRFVGHTGDVLSCSFDFNQCVIVSASRDKTVRAWNVIGDELYRLEGPNAHQDWVSGVCITPGNGEEPNSGALIVSVGWDKLIKTWDLNAGNAVSDFKGHTGYINSVTLSPDGTLCATGGKDGTVLVWNVFAGQFYYALPAANCEIHALAFSPSRYWLAAATEQGIKIYDLKNVSVLEELVAESETGTPVPISLAWSRDGQYLFSGHTDNNIRVWRVMQSV